MRRFGAVLLAVVLAFSCAGCAGRRAAPEPLLSYEDRLRLATIYLQGGQRERAIPVLEDAARREPMRPEAHRLLGEALYLGGDRGGAAERFRQALKAGGEDAVTLNNLAWVELEVGHADSALDLSRRALALDPSPRHAFLDTMARALAALGRREEAVAAAREALGAVPPHDASARAGLEALLRELEGGEASPP